MRKNKFLLAVVTFVLTAVLALGAFAADDIVFEFTDEASFKGWGTGYFRYNFEPGYFNGYAYEKSANLSDPMLFSPEINFQAEDYRYIIIHMKYTRDASWSKLGQIFFRCEGQSAFVAERCVSGPSYPAMSSGFTDIVFDMTKSANWKGMVTHLRIDPFDCPGSIGIKKITITNTLPEKEEETKPVETPKEEEQPKKQVGVFLKPNTYTNNFTDVPATEWYQKEVANAYELGLINGKSETSFDPNGNMTIAEAITLASRTKNNYGTADYDFTASAGEEWFAPYVKYATDNGIIKAGEYSDYNALATRGQMAKIFAAALPASEYGAINSVTSVPDVDKNADYAAAVLKLYNAGIVMGNDAYGTFNPNNNIIRAEAAAIINRIANKGNRLSKNLLVTEIPGILTTPVNMTSEAKYYMDDETFRNAHTGGHPSGWTNSPMLNKSSNSGVLSNTLTDNTEEHKTSLERKIIPAVTDGVLDFEFGTQIYGDNGAYLKFAAEDGTSVIELFLERGVYKYLDNDGTYKPTGAVQSGSLVHFDMKIDVDAKSFVLGMNGAYIGTFPFASGKPIAKFVIGSTEKGWVTIAPQYASLRHNWLATEKFVNAPDNILPYDISVINEGGKVSKVMMNTFNSNGGTLELSSNAGAKTGIYKQFAPASGNVVFETYVLLPEDINGAKVSLKNGNTDVFSLATKNGNFVTADGTVVKYVTKNLWHIVRFEADTATDTAVVKINGKVVGSYPFANAADVINGLEVTYAPSTASKMYVDEIAAFVQLPYPEDYVPEPVIPESDDYLVGLNVCSLWRNGTHYGWDEIAAYPEIEPVLGYYDEGTPETTDWEIKFMSEHGIDYEIFCWYADADTNKPIFRTTMNEAIVDGYFNARYSDKIQFAIMWENTSVDCKSWEAWTDYFVPYWIEYFFKDDRYIKINNKPLLTVWSSDALGQAFGEKSAKEAFDYLREECKKAGFDGCMIMLYSSDHTTSYAQSAKNNGIDCIGAYHYGSGGANLDKHLASLESLKNETTIDRIPAVSVGFDYLGWGYSQKRNGLLDPANYPVITDYIKNEILAKRDQNSIYSKMVIISTWNEYGEGTYVMPTARHGFAYLDGVRAAFTNGGEHEDVVPNAAQKQRINYLFDQSRQWLRPQLLVPKDTEEEKNPYEGSVDVHSLDLASIKWSSYGDTTTEMVDGVLHVKTNGKDPAIFSNSYVCNIPATDANGVRIRARVSGNQPAGSMELFFRTNDGKEFAADKVKTAKLVIGEWTDYYFDFRKTATWTGNIVNLRIDPANFAFDLAEIESVTFVKLPELQPEKEPFTVDINGANITLYKEPDITGGGLMIPLFPGEGIPAGNGGNGVLARMKAHYLWDKNTKELTIYTNEHTVKLFIGTDKIVIDGAESKTYAATYMYDGLPVVPFDTIAEALGYYVVWHDDKNGVSIMLSSAEDYNILNSRIPFEYEFDIEGDLEDWTLQGCSSLDTYNGFLVGNSNSNDPAVTSPVLNIEAEKYPVINVGMKYNRQNVGKNDHVAIFFKTANAGLSESRKVTIDLGIDNLSSNGEIVEFTFDMSKHLQWYGKITGIRFDPFNAPGTFEIDYIRFEKDMAAEMAELEKQIREENLDDTIYNGDANNVSYICSYSDNATITIVERDDEPGNNCFNVKANSGKTWTYFKQKVKFKPGTSYIVEFDVKTLGTNNGDTSPDLSGHYVVNAQYNGADHIVHAGSAKVSDGFVHMKVTVTIPVSCDNTKDVISVYVNPSGDLGMNYQIDNWKMYPM